MKRIFSTLAILASMVACAQKKTPPENLIYVKETVAQLDSAVTAMYGWEPQDSTYNHSIDTLVAGVMNEYKAYDEARVTWAEFKRLIDADSYKEALDFYLSEGDDNAKKNAGDFLIYLKHSTQRYIFFSEILRPLMQEYKGDDKALESYISNLQLEKALEDISIELQADNTGYVPEVYPFVVRDLGIALASSGKMDEARELFHDLIDGVYGLTGSALLANYIASDYVEKLYLIEDDKEGAIANWNRFKEAVEQNKSAYDPEEVEECLKRIDDAISALLR